MVRTQAVWQNWNSTVTCRPDRFATVTSVEEVQRHVNEAAARSQTVRVAGGGHSFGPVVATDDVLIDLRMDGSIDVQGAHATIPGGRRLYEFLDPLWDQGRALRNMGELDTTSLTGAIATGVHGTGLELPSISASLVRARLVTASGDVIEIDEASELMRAARVSLGLLGVMTETTIATVPAYHLAETWFYAAFDEVLEDWDSLLQDNRHFNVYLLPNRRAVETYADIFPPVPEGIAGETCFVQLRNACEPGDPSSDGMTRRDRMHRILSYEYPTQYREIEFALPLEEAKPVFRAVRAHLAAHHPNYAQPVDVRFVAQDDALLSWSHDGPKAVFSVPDDMAQGYSPVMAELEALFVAHGGWPHWGKEHRLTRSQLETRHPGVKEFLEIRRELDHSGVFLNDHLRDLFL